MSELFGLYIHWPFCKARCPYCDYNAHVRERVDVESFGNALLSELDVYGRETQGRALTSIFFGGGTPSLMPASLVEELIGRAQKYWAFSRDIEITLEANPTSSEAAHFQDLAKAGINRLSMGIQSLNPDDLKFLGRSHSKDEAVAAINLAAKHFCRYSFDLIYARPKQSAESWEKELREALQYGRDHFSFYQLSVEPQTAFATSHARGDFVLPDDDHAATLYDATLRIMGEHGFHAYEVSSFARNNDECQHNLCYWRYYDYIGVGCGSHGRITDANNVKHATQNFKMPESWQSAVERCGTGLEKRETLSAEDRAYEMILMNLRLQQGLDLARFQREIGAAVDGFIDQDALPALIAEGFVVKDHDRLRATEAGRNCLNALIPRILA